MEQDNLRQVKTNGEHLTVYQDWDNDGALRIYGARTLKNYRKLAYETHPDCYSYRCFYAYSKEQFLEGCRRINLDTEKGEKVVSGGSGLYGIKEGLTRLFNFYEELSKKIAAECDPEEVYYEEYNNYECCIDCDGDKRAIQFIIDTFGEQAARSVKRFRACYSIDEVIKGKN